MNLYSMKKQKIKILDTTLREGTQAVGVNLSYVQRYALIKEISKLPIWGMEIGMFNQSEILDVFLTKFFNEQRKYENKKIKFGISILSRKKDILKLINSFTPDIIFIIIPASSRLKPILNSIDEHFSNLNILLDNTSLQKDDIHLALMDASYNIEFDVINKFIETGFKNLWYADTFGILQPQDINRVSSLLNNKINKEFNLGTHCHNDFGLALANTLRFIEEVKNTSYVSSSINGIGDRAGITKTEEIISLLIEEFNLDQLIKISKLVEEFTSIKMSDIKPLTSERAFWESSGIHIDIFEKKLINLDKIKYFIGQSSGKKILKKFLYEKFGKKNFTDNQFDFLYFLIKNDNSITDLDLTNNTTFNSNLIEMILK